MAEHDMPKASGINKNYPGNSNTEKAKQAKTTESPEEKPERKMEKVVQGNVVERKKGLGRKILDTFTGGDEPHKVGEYVFFEVALPALKNLVSEMVSQAVERTLFGETSRRPGAARTIGRSFTNYGKYSSGSPAGRAGSADGPRELGYQNRANHNFNDIVIESRGEAEEVLELLREAVSVYQVATVADLYDLVGITPKFTDQKWGWTDLRDASIERVRDGFLVRLPRTEQID